MDLSKIKDTKDLQELLDLMGKYDLVELELTQDGQTVRLRKAEAVQPTREVIHLAAASVVSEAASAPPPAGAGSAADAPPGKFEEMTSPMVGTFYRAPSPEADPFVVEGDRVEPDSLVCIIEAMKVMNEIPAGVAGIVREILVRNGESVEYGQPLFRVEVE
jgi:acetyl-CoA carboxylase biotin carboxyl carrier protein